MAAGQQYNKHLNYDQSFVKTPAVYNANLDEWVMLSANIVKTEGGLLIYQKGTDDGKAKVSAELTGSNAPLGGQKNVTTAGTRVALTSGSQVYKKITIVAKTTNTGLIYVGDSTVDSTHGLILPAGGCSPDLEFVNTNAIYIDSSVSGEGVSWVGVI
jgi:hypothetical protein